MIVVREHIETAIVPWQPAVSIISLLKDKSENKISDVKEDIVQEISLGVAWLNDNKHDKIGPHVSYVVNNVIKDV